MLYGEANFRTTVVKPFYTEESPKPIEIVSEARQEASTQEATPSRTMPVVAIPRKSLRQLQAEAAASIENIPQAFLLKKEEQDLDLSCIMQASRLIKTSGLPFEVLIKTEIDLLIDRGVFEFVQFDPAKY